MMCSKSTVAKYMFWKLYDLLCIGSTLKEQQLTLVQIHNWFLIQYQHLCVCNTEKPFRDK